MAPVSPYHRQGCARLGVARLNAFRLNVYEPWIGAYVNGAPAALRIEGASISHILNDQTDTANFRTKSGTPAPVAGQAIAVFQGDTSITAQLFGGRIIEATALYEKKPDNVAYDLRCVDPTWLLNRQKVLGQYANQSASTIAIDIVTRFCRGITTRNVQYGLPSIDLITFTNENPADCLTALCQRIGGSWYLDYAGDLHVFLSEATPANAITDAQPHGSAEHQLTEDLSQVVTRVIGRGGGGTAAVDVQPDAIEIPVNEGDQQTWYSETGGLVEAPNAQRISYTAIKGRGGKGAQIGTGNAPTSQPTVSGLAGTGLASGAYQYAVSFANAAGEGLPGPVRPFTVTNEYAPSLNQTHVRAGYYSEYGNGTTPGGSYMWRLALYYQGGGYSLGPPTPAYVVGDRMHELYLGGIEYDASTGLPYYPALMLPPKGRIVQTEIYRTTNGGANFYLAEIKNGLVATGGYYLMATLSDTNLLQQNSAWPNGNYPTDTAQFGRALLSGLANIVAPSGFTGKNLYRTTVNGAVLKRLATNVTADTFSDGVADAALGANAPASDTSGVIVDSNKSVPPGAT